MKTKLFMLIVFLLSISITAFTQTSRGTVSGIVADQTAAVIPGAATTPFAVVLICCGKFPDRLRRSILADR